MRSRTTATRERARPLLGTIVRISVASGNGADVAIDAAFDAIACVHDRMSFQSETSDLAAITRAAPGEVVPLDPRTRECLARALAWAEGSDGVFDPVAAASPEASWRHLRLEERGVAVERRLRVDLSGIAKGYAVDAGCAALAAHGVSRAVVEAGGDLRVLGDNEEEVALRPSHDAAPALVALVDGALAASDPALARRTAGAAAHLDGRNRKPTPAHFVAVAAPCCVDADALTKIVLALGEGAASLLAQAGASAYRHDGGRWAVIGTRR